MLYPFSFQLDWNPSYSYVSIPEDWDGEIPAHWKVLARPVEPQSLGIPEFKEIKITEVIAKCLPKKGTNINSEVPPLISKAFDVYAYAKKPISKISWKNVPIEADMAGTIENAKDWTMDNVKVLTSTGLPVRLENCDHVQIPEVRRIDN